MRAYNLLNVSPPTSNVMRLLAVSSSDLKVLSTKQLQQRQQIQNVEIIQQTGIPNRGMPGPQIVRQCLKHNCRTTTFFYGL